MSQQKWQCADCGQWFDAVLMDRARMTGNPELKGGLCSGCYDARRMAMQESWPDPLAEEKPEKQLAYLSAEEMTPAEKTNALLAATPEEKAAEVFPVEGELWECSWRMDWSIRYMCSVIRDIEHVANGTSKWHQSTAHLAWLARKLRTELIQQHAYLCGIGGNPLLANTVKELNADP